MPSQLLLNRPDIRQAERELVAAGLDVKVARANFFPQVIITGGVGYQAFNPKYLFMTPDALIYNIAGGLVGPLVNFKAIQAEYLTANARQLQTVYNYQRVIINAVTEVVNRMSKVENYARSIEIKKQQVQSLEAAVAAATSLYQLPRGEFPIDYLDVLTAQNELFDAIKDLIDTKGEQLAAVVNTYQALGGGSYLSPIPTVDSLLPPKHQWHFKHFESNEMPQPGPPPPLPPVAGTSPSPSPSPPPSPVTEANMGPFSPPPAATGAMPSATPAAESEPEPLPKPAAEPGPRPAPPPAPPTDAEPLPKPAAENGQQPVPTLMNVKG